MDAYDATLALLAARASDATICPSEVARLLGAATCSKAVGSDWRSKMPTVHAAVDQLVTDGKVRLSWKGQLLSSRNGPYRIGRH